MSDLIKAEVYRLRRSSGFYVVGLCLLGIITSFFNCSSSGITRQNVIAAAPMGMVFVQMVIGIAIGRHYQNRTAYYEIMDGASSSQRILSRICVYVPLMTVLYFIPISVILMFCDGGAELVKFLSLFLIIFLRLLFFTICICIIFKTVEGAVLPYVRFMTEMLILMLLTDEEFGLSLDKVFSIMDWLPSFQCSSLSGGIDDTLIVKIIVGSLVEAVVMYALAYISNRKKWLIRSIFA